MAEILVNSPVCKNCGADIRPQSLFCYHCGAAVAAPAEAESTNGTKKLSEEWLRENISEKTVDNKKAPVKTKIIEKKDEKKIEDLQEAVNAKEEKSAPSLHEKAKLKSAAAMRQKAKSIQKREIEVVWEESEKVFSPWLIITVVGFTVFAVVIVILALSLK
jgi:hypothetical protein